MAVASALAAGAVIGVRHALETDHLAAVATLVESDDDRSVLVGASWGIGHSVPIIALGLSFVLLGIRLPEAVTALFEGVVGVVLMVLGVRMLWSVVLDAEMTTHDHGTGLHSHLRIGDLSIGPTHHHLDGDSLVVGLVHGFAGSGVLVIALASSAPTITAAVSFLGGFSLLSIGTMAAVSSVWGRTLGTGFTTYLKALAGIVGVGVGLVLLVEQVGHVPAL